MPIVDDPQDEQKDFAYLFKKAKEKASKLPSKIKSDDVNGWRRLNFVDSCLQFLEIAQRNLNHIVDEKLRSEEERIFKESISGILVAFESSMTSVKIVDQLPLNSFFRVIFNAGERDEIVKQRIEKIQIKINKKTKGVENINRADLALIQEETSKLEDEKTALQGANSLLVVEDSLELLRFIFIEKQELEKKIDGLIQSGEFSSAELKILLPMVIGDSPEKLNFFLTAVDENKQDVIVNIVLEHLINHRKKRKYFPLDPVLWSLQPDYKKRLLDSMPAFVNFDEAMAALPHYNTIALYELFLDKINVNYAAHPKFLELMSYRFHAFSTPDDREKLLTLLRDKIFNAKYFAALINKNPIDECEIFLQDHYKELFRAFISPENLLLHDKQEQIFHDKLKEPDFLRKILGDLDLNRCKLFINFLLEKKLYSLDDFHKVIDDILKVNQKEKPQLLKRIDVHFLKVYIGEDMFDYSSDKLDAVLDGLDDDNDTKKKELLLHFCPQELVQAVHTSSTLEVIVNARSSLLETPRDVRDVSTLGIVTTREISKITDENEMLENAKKHACAPLQKYTNFSHSFMPRHHHQKRALNVTNEINNATSIKAIKSILLKQRTLFDQSAAPEEKTLKNIKKGGYYDSLNVALASMGDFLAQAKSGALSDLRNYTRHKSSFTLFHHHHERAEVVMCAINAASSLEEIKTILEKQINIDRGGDVSEKVADVLKVKKLFYKEKKDYQQAVKLNPQGGFYKAILDAKNRVDWILFFEKDKASLEAKVECKNGQ